MSLPKSKRYHGQEEAIEIPNNFLQVVEEKDTVLLGLRIGAEWKILAKCQAASSIGTAAGRYVVILGNLPGTGLNPAKTVIELQPYLPEHNAFEPSHDCESWRTTTVNGFLFHYGTICN